MKRADEAMGRAAAQSHQASVERLSAVLHKAVARGADALPTLRENLVGGLGARLDEMRLALSAEPVTLESHRRRISRRRDWVARTDGLARIEVYPKGDASNNEVLRRFVAAVRTVAPEATGAPISIQNPPPPSWARSERPARSRWWRSPYCWPSFCGAFATWRWSWRRCCWRACSPSPPACWRTCRSISPTSSRCPFCSAWAWPSTSTL